MTPEIAELIKKKAEIYSDKIHLCDVEFENEEARAVYLCDHPEDLATLYKCSIDSYTTGQIEAIEMMIRFMLWADDNYWRLGNKDEWVYEIGEDDSPVFTTIELLNKYIKEVL